MLSLLLSFALKEWTRIEHEKNVSKKGQRSSNKFKPKQCASQSNTVVMARR